MFDLLDQIGIALDRNLLLAVLVFLRIGAAAALMPGIGETFIPVRVRLAMALALTARAAPIIGADAVPAVVDVPRFVGLALGEAAIGLVIGIAVRMLVMALQYAGTIAAQSTALAQMAGPAIAPEPMPAIGNTLLIAGLTLAMVLDLHIKAILSLVGSYEVLGMGAVLVREDVAWFGVEIGKAAFELAFSLAAPFILAAFLYNVALGLINRAMPQLMVAFVGAPVITGVTLVLLLLSAPVSLAIWHAALDARLGQPLGLP